MFNEGHENSGGIILEQLGAFSINFMNRLFLHLGNSLQRTFRSYSRMGLFSTDVEFDHWFACCLEQQGCYTSEIRNGPELKSAILQPTKHAVLSKHPGWHEMNWQSENMERKVSACWFDNGGGQFIAQRLSQTQRQNRSRVALSPLPSCFSRSLTFIYLFCVCVRPDPKRN